MPVWVRFATCGLVLIEAGLAKQRKAFGWIPHEAAAAFDCALSIRLILLRSTTQLYPSTRALFHSLGVYYYVYFLLYKWPALVAVGLYSGKQAGPFLKHLWRMAMVE